MARRRLAIEIRRATPADRKGLEPLWREVDELHVGLRPDFFRRGARTLKAQLEALAGGDQVVLVAEAGGQPIGMVHVELYDTPPLPVMVPCRRAHIEDLVVSEAYRRRGVGRKLMAAAGRWAQKKGATQVVLTVWQGNTAAQGFYRALGYEDVAHQMKRDL